MSQRRAQGGCSCICALTNIHTMKPKLKLRSHASTKLGMSAAGT
jgi:hypothetical protein